MSDWLIAALVIPGGLIGGTVIGWLTIQDIPDRPWNWRVLAGPIVYGYWIDRRRP